MDNDAASTSPTLPRNVPFEPGHAARPEAAGPRAASVAVERDDRTGVFGHLVTDDRDIAGLVAYSIYKQNKLDWLRAFEAANGRQPDDRELAAYIIGEGTPRRLATYRHLAEATLAGNGPDVAGRPATGRSASPVRPLSGGVTGSPAMIAAYALIAAVVVAVLWMALHFTAAGH